MSRPAVSVVVVNYNGGDETLRCLEDLVGIRLPDGGVEVIVVDNGSTDGSLETLRARGNGGPLPVRIVEMGRNRGFAGGCNAGAREAAGRHLAFLNNDARPDPDWLVAAVAVLERRIDVACVASKVLSWDGERADFVGGGVTFYGFGYRKDFGQPHRGDDGSESDVLFATGSAMVVKADVFRDVGGFDERFFLFFEDVDFGWRLWLLGWRVRYVPTSVVFHRHHGTMRRFGRWREDFLLERNALLSLVKNLDDERLAKALPVALLMAARRGVLAGEADASVLDLEAGVTPDESRALTVNRETIAPLYAMDAVVTMLPDLLASRADLQARRVRSDGEIFALVTDPLLPSRVERTFVQPLQQLVELFGIDTAFSSRRRIAIVTGDPLQPKMAGPGIRAWEMARVLATTHDVRLLTTAKCDISSEDFAVAAVGRTGLAAAEGWCDVLVFQGFLLTEHPFLARSKKVLVADVYDPFHLEQLEQLRNEPAKTRALSTATALEVLSEQLRRGDFFLCASDKQRDFWLGQLAGVGRVNPITYDADPNLDGLIAVAPFGLPAEPPTRTRDAIKGVVPGIERGDKVVLWGGGIYSWFDPATVIAAVVKAQERRPDVRLLFLGTRHPNPLVPPMASVTQARDLAVELGALDRCVFFNDGWVDYDDRQNYLLDADIGVSAHLEHIETAFSFRTRILDYVWAGLPIVTSGGDALGDMVEQRALGLVVAPGDVDGLADALVRLLDDEDLRASAVENLAAVRTEMTWERALAPLTRFCAEPRRAPDLVVDPRDVPWARPRVRGAGGGRELASLFVERLGSEGPAETMQSVKRYVRRRLGRG